MVVTLQIKQFGACSLLLLWQVCTPIGLAALLSGQLGCLVLEIYPSDDIHS